MQDEMQKFLKQQLLTAGLNYQEIVTVMDLATHAAKEMEKLFMRTADSAPSHLHLHAMVAILAMSQGHLNVLLHASRDFLAEKAGL